MEYSAKGLRVVVTAGAAGIGRAIARTFAGQGARVHICDIDDKALKEMTDLAPEVTQSRADVSSVADVERLFQDAKQRLGGLDVLTTTPASQGRPRRWRTSARRTGSAASRSI